MHASALFSFLTLALVAFAEPIRIRDSQISFPVAKRVNSTVGAAGLALRDKQRAKFLKQSGGSLRQASSVGSIPSTNQLVDYVVGVSLFLVCIISVHSADCMPCLLGPNRNTPNNLSVISCRGFTIYLNFIPQIPYSSIQPVQTRGSRTSSSSRPTQLCNRLMQLYVISIHRLIFPADQLAIDSLYNMEGARSWMVSVFKQIYL